MNGSAALIRTLCEPWPPSVNRDFLSTNGGPFLHLSVKEQITGLPFLKSLQGR
jgi:hypothetical protein